MSGARAVSMTRHALKTAISGMLCNRREMFGSVNMDCVTGSAWGSGLSLVMTPFTVLDGSTKSINGTFLYTVQNSFFVRESRR
jgi:hypothetical protein